MKTSELAIGMQVAYKPYQHSQMREAFVMAVRPKGKAKSDWYYGKNNWGNDTIGIAYTYNGNDWGHDWVQPRQIEMTWAEKLHLDAKAAEHRAAREAKAKAERIARRKQWNALPPKVQELVDTASYHPIKDDLIRGYSPSVRLTVELISAIVAAAQDAVPEVAHAKQQAEVEAALANLAGM